MLSSTFSELVLYIAVYGIFGWLIETVAASIANRRYVNRGFLEGPFSPIYGFGAVFVLSLTLPIAESRWLVFLAAMTVTTAFDLVSYWISGKLFQLSLTPYPFSRTLYGWLGYLLVAGGIGLLGTYVVHPRLRGLVALLQPHHQRVLASILIVVFVLDFLYSLDIVTGLGRRLRELKDYLDELEHYEHGTEWLAPGDLPGSVSRLRDICRQEPESAQAAEILTRLDELLGNQDRSLRLLRAYPHLHPQGLGSSWEDLLDYWETDRQKRSDRLRETVRRLKSKTVSTAREINPFQAQGISFHKLVWVFAIGSVLGYLIETVWCLIRHGVIESRQGMIYGPFNQVYGFGAVLMVLLLRPFAKKNDRWLFLGGALVGGGFEWVCSWLQEKNFGTVSWEYSNQPFSLGGGRTSLLYMFFWGILGVVYMKSIYPRLSRVIGRIPRRPGILFSWILAVGLSANMLVSALAVSRWSERQQGIPAENAVADFLDNRYPNEMLAEIYPNMQVVS